MLSAWVKSLSLFTLGNLHCTEPKNLWIEYALLFFISALLVSTDPRSVLLPFQKNSSQGSQTTKPAHQWYRRIKGLFSPTSFDDFFTKINDLVHYYLKLAAFDSYLFVNKLAKKCNFYVRTFDQNVKKVGFCGQDWNLRRIFPLIFKIKIRTYFGTVY